MTERAGMYWSKRKERKIGYGEDEGGTEKGTNEVGVTGGKWVNGKRPNIKRYQEKW